MSGADFISAVAERLHKRSASVAPARGERMAIKITADRMIDLDDCELNELGISTMPCFVNMGGQSYNDMVDVFPEEVFTHFERTNEVAKTAAKSPEHYVEFFQPFLDNGDTIIHFATSSGISSLCNNAKTAASQLGSIYVIDTLTLSNGIALLAKFALSLIEGGETDAQRIYELCMAKRDKVCGAFIIETLDCLYRGGRCSSMQYYGANLLKIRPVIAMNESGQMKVCEKFHGNYRRAIAKFIHRMFTKYPAPDLSQLCLLHFCKDKSIEDYLLQTIAEYHKFENITFNNGSCNCAIHSGRNTIGIFFLSND